MAETRSERVVKRFFKTLNTGNLERLRALFHEQATWTIMGTGMPGAGEMKGRHAIIDEFLGPVRGQFVPGDPKIHIDRVISKGPVVAVEARGHGRLTNGKEYNNRYAFMIEVKGGKVFALKEYMDSYHVSTLA